MILADRSCPVHVGVTWVKHLGKKYISFKLLSVNRNQEPVCGFLHALLLLAMPNIYLY